MSRVQSADTEPAKRYAIFGVDGEGFFDTETQSHSYDIFTSGSTTLNGEGEHIQLSQIVDLLRSQALACKKAGIIPVFIGYFYNYDVTQQIRSLSDYHLEKLAERSARSFPGKPSKKKETPRYKRASDVVIPVKVEDGDTYSPDWFSIDYLEGKKLTLTVVDPDSLPAARASKNPKLIEKITITVQDVGTLFGASFLKTIDDFHIPLTAVERLMLEEGKANRAIDATKAERAAHIDEVISYNRLEIAIVYRLIATLYNTLTEIGMEVDLTRDIGGIGAVASKFIKTKAKSYEIIPAWEIAEAITPEFYKAANASYFGGWAETLAPGLHDSMEQYDITSAYPHVMRNLPSLKDAKPRHLMSWSQAKMALENGAIVFVDIDAYGESDYCGPLPFRTKQGANVRPRNVSGVYVLTEVLASIRAGLLTEDGIDFNRGWAIFPTSAEKPLAYIADLFEERIRVGKKTAIGAMMKLLINSHYGKLAQSIGNPVYANPIWATLITAGARAQVLDAIASHPNGVADLLAVATDAVFFRSPHPNLDMTPNKLGAWEGTGYRDTFLLKPGIWGGIEEDGDDDQWHAKTRGIGYGAFAEKLTSHVIPTLEGFREAKQWDESVSFRTSQSFAMMTLGEAFARGKVDQVGEFMVGDHGVPELVRSVGFGLFPKRTRIRWDESLGSFTSDTAIMTDFTMDIPRSKAYDKLIGAVQF